jgi:hypothetical protein
LIFADATGNKEIIQQMKEGYQPYCKGSRKPRKGHVDCNVSGIWPLEMYHQTGDVTYLKTGIALADHEYESIRKVFQNPQARERSFTD